MKMKKIENNEIVKPWRDQCFLNVNAQSEHRERASTLIIQETQWI